MNIPPIVSCQQYGTLYLYVWTQLTFAYGK